MNKTIILHGWTKNTDKWQPFLSELKSKKIDYIFPKIPGLTSELKEAWDLADYVEWLKEIVDKEKGKIVLVGHSNGGRIAIAFAIKYPQKIEKLILIDSAGIYHNELLHRIKLFVFKTIAKIGKKLTSSKKMEDLLYKLAREGDYKDNTPTVKQTMINLLNSNKSLDIPLVSNPTLIIWGKDDKITPLSDGISINNLIKNSKLETIEGAKHSPMHTHTKQVAKIIYEYL